MKTKMKHRFQPDLTPSEIEFCNSRSFENLVLFELENLVKLLKGNINCIELWESWQYRKRLITKGVITIDRRKKTNQYKVTPRALNVMNVGCEK